MQDNTSTTITEPETDPKRRYRCRHIFTDGHRCGSPALRNESLCYYHQVSRHCEPRLAGRNGYFIMPRIDDRPAIQIAIYDVLGRLSQFDIDPKRAGMILYGLQIASSNLAQQEKLRANPEPVVEEIVDDVCLGTLAPIAEIPTAEPVHEAAPTSEAVILSEAKNPRIPSEAPQTTAHTAESSRRFKTTEPAKLILAAVHATAASSCPPLEPRTLNLEPTQIPSPVPPPAAPYNRPNDFAYSGLPASPRAVPLPG